MMRCAQCSTDLIAPVRSQYFSDRHVCHVWLCPKCSTRFESCVQFPDDSASISAVMEENSAFSSLLVA